MHNIAPTSHGPSLCSPLQGNRRVLLLGEGGLPNPLPTLAQDHAFPPNLTGRSQGKITKVHSTLSCPQSALSPLCPLPAHVFNKHGLDARHQPDTGAQRWTRLLLYFHYVALYPRELVCTDFIRWVHLPVGF